jgi:hypothetical protein
MDRDWWLRYIDEVRQTFRAELMTTASTLGSIGLKQLRLGNRAMPTFGNSGAGAVALAAYQGASRVVLLGYDLQQTGGKVHWHGNHPAGLGNAGSLHKWPAQFQKLAHSVSGIKVVNATRQTALEVFPKMTLEEALCS